MRRIAAYSIGVAVVSPLILSALLVRGENPHFNALRDAELASYFGGQGTAQAWCDTINGCAGQGDDCGNYSNQCGAVDQVCGPVPAQQFTNYFDPEICSNSMGNENCSANPETMEVLCKLVITCRCLMGQQSVGVLSLPGANVVPTGTDGPACMHIHAL